MSVIPPFYLVQFVRACMQTIELDYIIQWFICSLRFLLVALLSFSKHFSLCMTIGWQILTNSPLPCTFSFVFNGFDLEFKNHACFLVVFLGAIH